MDDMSKKIWLVKFPTYQYNEDVQSLAMMNGLKIIDDRNKDRIGDKFIEKNPPKLTIKGAKPKKQKSTKQEDSKQEVK